MAILQETESEESWPIHPLLVDHIVAKILSYVDSINGNLLECRRVCKVWNEIATSLHKCKQQVEVGSYSTSVAKFRRLIKIWKHRPNANKRNKEDGWPCLFVKFRLCQEIFQPIYSSVITDFFQTFQNNLEVLDIWLDLRSTLSQVPVHSKSKLCSFPNLKTLVYDDRRVILEEKDDSRGSLLKTLVQLGPNIKNLNIRFQRDFRGSVECASEPVLNHMRSIFCQDNIRKSLKSLKLDVHLNDQLLACLQCSTLKVDALEISLRGSNFSFMALHNFFQSVQGHLRRLKISYIERDSSCLLNFPVMPTLTNLEVEGTDAFSKHSVSFGEFTYKENFPRLQVLRISIWATVNLRWGQFFHLKRPVLTMQELKLPGELCDRAMMNCVAGVFPNLMRLHISVHALTLDSMEMIFENMTQLEELTVTKFPSLWDRSEKNIDHILTGISVTDCEKLWRENVPLGRISEDELHGLKTRPGLTDLQRLRKLMMPDLQYQASYTDITGYLAFQRMTNLKCLNVGRSYLGSSCLTQLGKKFPEMEQQRKLPPAYFKEPDDDDDDGSFLDLPGDTCVYL